MGEIKKKQTIDGMDDKEREFWRLVGILIAQARENIKYQPAHIDGRRRAMTQGRLAAMLGLSRPTIANIETGRQRVDLYQMIRIMNILDIPSWPK